jgi:cell division protease FtsH
MHQHRQFSEHTMELIDQEVAKILHHASSQASELLTAQRENLVKLAEALLKEEELGEAAIAELIGPSVHAAKDSNGRAKSK